MKTMLQIVQEVCKDVGQPRPSVVASATTETPLRLLRLLNKAGQQLIKDHDWNALLTVQTFTATATQAQSSHPPSDFDRFTSQTELWDTGNKRRVVGPLPASKWLQLITNSFGSVTKNWTMIAGQINIYPVPTALDTFVYAYQSKKWALNSAASPIEEFTADDDTPRLPDELLILETIWRWKQAIGIDYAEDMASAARMKEMFISADRANHILNLSMPIDQFPDNFLDQAITG